MCTAISFRKHDHYFGRNLDLEFSYHESVTITPRNFSLQFRCTGVLNTHYAMIGVATVDHGYPLYYDATNERGLSMAALNFPGCAHYFPPCDCAKNVAPFEFIPWVLAQCETIEEVILLLKDVQIADIAYSEEFLLTPLHWIVSDRNRSIVLEPVVSGLRIHENPIGILTNSPTFDFHLQNLRQYLNLTRKAPVNRFSETVELSSFSRGIGAFGLPGDLSSASRFIRGAFVKLNAVCEPTEDSCVSQFFHILQSVAQQRGCVQVGDHYEITLYSSCCNTDSGQFYYTTYENSQITCVNMHSENLDASEIKSFPLIHTQQIRKEN